MVQNAGMLPVAAMTRSARSAAVEWRWRSVILLALSLEAVALWRGGAMASTDPAETAALFAMKQSLIDTAGNLASWYGDDPCGDAWVGVLCVEGDYPSRLVGSNVSHVTELRLLQLNLRGELSEEIGKLVALKVFDVMWNQITGTLPSTIGTLSNLKLLLLSGNQFYGLLPPVIGTLPNLVRLQIDQNGFSGPVPDTFLDRNLPMIHHLHMNNNSLNGSIPAALGTLPNLAHLLLDNNQLSGPLPPELANAPSLAIIQLDNNNFDNTTIPKEYGAISTLLKLSLRNCNLRGSIPDFSLSPQLAYLDLSHNSLTGPIPNTSLSSNVTTIDLSYNLLTGSIPETIGALPALQYLMLEGNNLSGVIPANLGSAPSFTATASITIVNLQNNAFVDFAKGSNLVTLQGGGKTKVWLAGDPFCSGSNSANNNPLCVAGDAGALLDVGQLNQIYSFDQGSCTPCPSPYVLAPFSSAPDKCRCAAPIVVKTRLKSYSFGVFDAYKQRYLAYMSSGLHLQLDQVQIRDFEYQPGPRLGLTLLLFPTGFVFNESEVSRLYNVWSTWGIPLDPLFGPYEFISFETTSGERKSGSSGLSSGPIAAIVAGVIVFVVLKTACMYYVLRFLIMRRRGRKGSRKSSTHKGIFSSIQVSSVRSFTYMEMANATDDFSDARVVGQGGYGKVYSGVLEDGTKVAIKRAEEGSHQGAHEFHTEILLLSRVHHKNLVMLIGYCNDDDEEMLVYEFIVHGSLQHHLSPAARVPLNFMTRFQIALGSARGIHYLHTQANPPIYHRDVKTSNILLDEKFHAKVSDFGLSKLAPDNGFEGVPGYISTVVKGTPGYLDPEYFKTHRLTDKSDVYSYGVVLLVLLTGMQPISDGKNLVREVGLAYIGGKLSSVVDVQIRESYSSIAFSALTRLGLSCCEDKPSERPTITEVVQQLELLWKETFSDGTSDLSDIDLTQLRKDAESESFIEINPSMESSLVTSDLWTSSESEQHSALQINSDMSGKYQ